jgi:hypothetical protein
LPIAFWIIVVENIIINEGKEKGVPILTLWTAEVPMADGIYVSLCTASHEEEEFLNLASFETTTPTPHQEK